MGLVLDALEQTNQIENTIIFLLSDNGPYQEEGYEKMWTIECVRRGNGKALGRLRGGKVRFLREVFEYPELWSIRTSRLLDLSLTCLCHLLIFSQQYSLLHRLN